MNAGTNRRSARTTRRRSRRCISTGARSRSTAARTKSRRTSSRRRSWDFDFSLPDEAGRGKKGRGMDFELSDEQRLLKDSVERLAMQRYDFEARRKYMAQPDGWSRDMWRHYIELGLTALPFAEEHGGIGGGPVETMIVMEAFGRALALEPYFATVVLGGAFLRLGANDATRAELLPTVAAGEALLA